MDTAIKLQQAERNDKIVSLRLRGMPVRQIAKRFPDISHQRVSSIISERLAASKEEQRKTLSSWRDMELLKLEDMEHGLCFPDVKIGSGDASKEIAERVYNIIGRSVRVIDARLRIIQTRAKMLGLNAPERIEVVTVLDRIADGLRDALAGAPDEFSQKVLDVISNSVSPAIDV